MRNRARPVIHRIQNWSARAPPPARARGRATAHAAGGGGVVSEARLATASRVTNGVPLRAIIKMHSAVAVLSTSHALHNDPDSQ